MRIVQRVAYDGRNFHGWQTQPSGQGIQDVVEAALSELADHPVATVCAGRTDTGVHALAQTVHFDTCADRPLQAWVRGVNSRLPDSVAILDAWHVRDDFHARFDATQRRYAYLLYSSAVRHPLLSGRAGWTHRALNIEAIRAGARALVGTHDYSSFRSSQCQAASPVRTINDIQVDRVDGVIRLQFVANAFLHHMIRNIVGALVYVGDGRQAPEWIAQVLAARDRSAAAPTFSAEGLYFLGARYPDSDALPGVADAPALGGLQ